MASDESSMAARVPLLGCLCLVLLSCCTVSGESYVGSTAVSVARRDERTVVAHTEYGEISSVDVGYGRRGTYHLQFITLEPNSLFLPVLLHAEMVLYVHTGSGRLTWVDEDDTRRIDIRRGDVYRLPPGTIFHIQSDLQPQQRGEKLGIHAIFINMEESYCESPVGEYSSVGDLLRGFDRKVLQEAFKVPAELVDEILNATRPPAIIRAGATATSLPKKQVFWEWEARILKSYLVGGESLNKNKKKTKAFNVFDADKDFENCNGWSLTVTKNDLRALKHADIGVFMVNLTKGSMMGPHWNPHATEVAIVLHGQGMIRVVCASSSSKESECKNTRLSVKKGDVFMVQRFHPMAQMSYNNESFVFMGFSTAPGRNYPQFFAGRSSVLQAIGREVLSVSFNVPNTTVEKLMETQTDSVILECTSCAEEEERLMKEEIEREKERREEEEERRRREEEEERRKAEEERRKEEEEEERRKEEEEEEEERRQGREEEEWRRRRSEEAKREEEEAKRQEAEMERRQREAAARGGGRSVIKEWEEEEEERRKEEEEEEEERRQGREEEEWRRRRSEEAKREEEEAKRQEAEMERRQREAAARGGGRSVIKEWEEEEKRKRGEKEGRPEEEGQPGRRRKEEEEVVECRKEVERRKEMERRKRMEEEEEKRRQQREEKEWRKRSEEAKREEEGAKGQEEEMERRQREAAARGGRPSAAREWEKEEQRKEEEEEEEVQPGRRRKEEEEERRRQQPEEEWSGRKSEEEWSRRRSEKAKREEKEAKIQEAEMERWQREGAGRGGGGKVKVEKF
ncbi:hypothetical protein SAY86_017996 [Trapa natans]|uniref:Cupin type-1 domain-containing protein n=1 Tax=Trapa natans TaxID=22666 RepID=A0AAN7LRA1_TRANT|nr:hypothetical protein SAY86_017996 [Trapa natans]